MEKMLHHIHLPSHETWTRIEHFFLDKWFWTAVGIILLIAGFIFLAVWAAKEGTPGDRRMYYPYLP